MSNEVSVTVAIMTATIGFAKAGGVFPESLSGTIQAWGTRRSTIPDARLTQLSHASRITLSAVTTTSRVCLSS